LSSLEYETHLWQEKEIKSVANICRSDVVEFLQLADSMHLAPKVEEYPVVEANRVLVDLKMGKTTGSKVLVA